MNILHRLLSAIIGQRMDHLTVGQLTGTHCAKCGREFVSWERVEDFGRSRGRNLYACVHGCIVEIVDDKALENLFAARVPDAMIYFLGLDDDPDPEWLAAQTTTTLTVTDSENRVVVRAVPLPYALRITTQAINLGMDAAVGESTELAEVAG
jgi:hypothetical protein